MCAGASLKLMLFLSAYTIAAHLWEAPNLMYVGIDPGQKGGICFLNEQKQIEHIEPMPKPDKLASIIKASIKTIKHVCLEKSHSHSNQGIRSTFSYAEGYGIIQGILIANKVPFSLVHPRTWQKHLILTTRLKDSKAKALYSANRHFKKNKSFWLPTSRHRTPHDGIIDAALIALYCRLAHKN